MNNYLLRLYLGLTLIFITSAFYLQTGESHIFPVSKDDKIFGKEYFPTELKKTLIYDSSFGDLN